jgi:glycosyltransferase involved in cell wall biosynthesis
MTASGRDRATVVVSDAGFLPTTRQMALAVSDVLLAYFTPYWTGSVGGRLLRTPGLGNELARRRLAPELRCRARSFQTETELLRIALGRLGVHSLARRLIWHRNVVFDRRVAGALRAGPRTIVGQYGASLATFRRAGACGARTILDYPIAQLDFTYRLLAEEARLVPEFADTIYGSHALAPKPEHLRRIAAEVELADVIVVGSKFAAASFDGAVDATRVVVVPYGADTTTFRPVRRQDDGSRLRVLFVGQLTQRKGIGYLLRAVELLDPARFELTLVGPVIGSGRGLRPHERLFRHRGTILPQQMPSVYADADVLVLPSLVEGSAVAVLEAMASGLPVIVTANAGADAVRDGIEGFVVPIRDAGTIAARLTQLAADAELRTRMGRAARDAATGADWASFRQRFRVLVDAPDARPAAEEVPVAR